MCAGSRREADTHCARQIVPKALMLALGVGSVAAAEEELAKEPVLRTCLASRGLAAEVL